MNTERLTVAEAEQMALDWAANYARRDEMVRAVKAAGLTKLRIHKLTGIARTTIDRILEETAVLYTEKLATQINATLGDHPEDFDIEGIVEEIGDTYGRDLVDIDLIPSDEYWTIIRKYDRTA